MTRRCSHCSNNGHNSRTCPTRGGVRLFGVRLTDGSIKKSASMGNLSSAQYHTSSSASPNPSSPSSDPLRDPTPVAEGYVSDDPAHASCSSNCRGERKKGNPWTEEEHRLFLMGLQKLGKGDWRGIARKFVISRSPTQCIDLPPMPEEQLLLHTSEAGETEHVNLLPPLNLSLKRECEPMEATSSEIHTETKESVSSSNFTPIIPTFFQTYLPVPFPFWPPNPTPAEEEKEAETCQHQVLKPIPILSKDPVNVDELIGMSQLSLGEASGGRIEPSPLSLKLLGTPSRQSAFHANAPVRRLSVSSLGHHQHSTKNLIFELGTVLSFSKAYMFLKSVLVDVLSGDSWPRSKHGIINEPICSKGSGCSSSGPFVATYHGYLDIQGDVLLENWGMVSQFPEVAPLKLTFIWSTCAIHMKKATFIVLFSHKIPQTWGLGQSFYV
ncbi:hypothetical protein HHK36_021686 [Tetracentron sinense]|uniref:Uncharacterized protein n=1 Tax=Tetracentron sinense TaxID=13715 RepID=A0A834YXE3_TETSI|nr:hypothetical protein HHK36_021686 [Tetracentron sinense]